MIAVTVLILTHNEERNISRTLTALPESSHVVLVDSLSDDKTVEIATAANPRIRVFSRKFESHTVQWNFGLDQVATEWVLTLDADYELSAGLRAEISAVAPSDDIDGYSAEFIYRIYGRSLRGSSYPPRIVLFRVKEARYVDDGHTQTLWVKDATGELKPPSRLRDHGTTGQQDQRIGRLNGKIYHDDRKPLSHWIQAQDGYAILEARHLLESGKRTAENGEDKQPLSLQDRLRLKIFFAAPAMFLYLMFVRGLVLDGWPGWFYVAQRTIAELLLSIRLLIEKYSSKDEKAIR